MGVGLPKLLKPRRSVKHVQSCAATERPTGRGWLSAMSRRSRPSARRRFFGSDLVASHCIESTGTVSLQWTLADPLRMPKLSPRLGRIPRVCYMRATPIQRRCHVSNVRGVKFQFRNWSGARDLNPGPHGPEPCRCRVLRCPTDSRGVPANTKSTRLVSSGDPLEPSGAGNA